MKLSDRGVHYEYNHPTLEVTEGEILGQHRGTGWRCQTLQEVPVVASTVPLKYGGVAYTPSSPAPVHPTDVAPAKAARSLQSVVIPETAPILAEITRIHRTNLERNLERRLRIAKAQGNQVLIRLLEAERQQLV